MKLFNIFNLFKKKSPNLKSPYSKNRPLANEKIEKITLNQMEKELRTIDIFKQTKTKRL